MYIDDRLGSEFGWVSDLDSDGSRIWVRSLAPLTDTRTHAVHCRIDLSAMTWSAVGTRRHPIMHVAAPLVLHRVRLFPIFTETLVPKLATIFGLLRVGCRRAMTVVIFIINDLSPSSLGHRLVSSVVTLAVLILEISKVMENNFPKFLLS